MVIRRSMSVWAVLLSCALCVTGCEQAEVGISGPDGAVAEASSIGDMGRLHNAFVQDAFDLLDADVGKGSGATESQKNRAAWRAANRMLAQYGLEAMSLEEVVRHVEAGREAARSVLAADELQLERAVAEVRPDFLERDHGGLKSGASSLEFHERYLHLRLVEGSARAAHAQVCREFGEPVADSSLAIFLDVMVHSDEFWSSRYPEIASGSMLIGSEKGIRKVIQFVCLTTVDAGSGLLVGAGYAAVGGPAAAAVGGVLGAVVGGLASWGANDVFFS